MSEAYEKYIQDMKDNQGNRIRLCATAKEILGLYVSDQGKSSLAMLTPKKAKRLSRLLLQFAKTGEFSPVVKRKDGK